MGAGNSKATPKLIGDAKSEPTPNGPQIAILNTFIDETIKACLAFTAKENELDKDTITQNKSLRYRKNCLVPNLIFFPAKHFDLAKAAHDALIAVKQGVLPISDDIQSRLDPYTLRQDTFTFSDDTNSKIDFIATVLTCYCDQLLANKSKRYLAKLTIHFKNLELSDNNFETNLIKHIKSLIKPKSPQPSPLPPPTPNKREFSSVDLRQQS